MLFRSDDWDHRRTAQQVEDDLVARALEHGDGAILLSHTWPLHTHAALAGTIRRLREAGAEFVTVDRLPPSSVPDSFGEVDW